VSATSFAVPPERLLRRFSKDRRGSVIVEFALISIPFFMLLLGVLEAGVVFFGSSVLERATADAARLIRTGQVQAQSMTALQFHDFICGEIQPVLPCANLQVDVESFSTFSGITIPNPIVNGQLNQNLNNYAVGGPGDIVLVRTFYPWTIITPLLKPFFADLSSGQKLLTSASAFRNEPF